AAVEIPECHRAVLAAARREQLPVLAEGHAPDVLAEGPDLAQLLAADHLPHLNRSIIAEGRQHLAIRSEDDLANAIASLDSLQGAASGEIPEDDLPLLRAGRSQELAVGADVDAEDAVA